jgi:hypothetical protein
MKKKEMISYMWYCVERRNRILIAVYAYAYEFDNTSLVTDSEFDELSKQINIKQSTKDTILDKFFNKHFQPCTGMWIHKHPELEKIKDIYEKYFKKYIK